MRLKCFCLAEKWVLETLHEKFQFPPRSVVIRFDLKFNVWNGWIFQDQKVGGCSPVWSELHYISSRTLTLGITNNRKYFIQLFIFHVTFSSSRFWVHENSVVFVWWPIMLKSDSNFNFVCRNKGSSIFYVDKIFDFFDHPHPLADNFTKKGLFSK